MMYSRALLNENKWRAGRYGIDGSMIDFGKEAEVNTRVLIYELLDFVSDVIPHLGSQNAISHVHKILENGTGADRQLKVYEESKEIETFRFICWNEFSSEVVTLPIDKIVADLVKANGTLSQ